MKSCATKSSSTSKPVAEQQPHREPRRAALRHQQAADRPGGPPDAPRRQLRRVRAQHFIDEYFGNELDQTWLDRVSTNRQQSGAKFVKSERRAHRARSAARSINSRPRRGSRSPNTAASSRPCRRASARPVRRRRKWSRPTCASSSRSPRSTPTAACSSWT